MTSERVPPNQHLIKESRWPIVGERAPRVDDAPWTLKITGEVVRDRVVEMEELAAMPQTERSIDVHCVTRWSKPAMRFGGVPLSDLIADRDDEPIWTPSAGFVSFVARSDRNHSTSLPLSAVRELDPMIALRYDGKPLPTEHGGPIRMVVPGRYFYKSVKWLERIEFLRDDRLGYWEAEAGYHNEADPWKEQRYIAATIGKQEAARMIADRDFSGRDLLSLRAAGLELSHLNAEQASLRNADFRGADLRCSNFAGANLSNARMSGADLRAATFRGADLEGAEFSGCDLRGADLRETSLFGATFCDFDAEGFRIDVARFDGETKVDEASLETLTREQRAAIGGPAPGG